MKNSTKIRLHLSKQLFESLAKQVLTEAKTKQNLGAGMEEVKATKEKKEKEHKEKEVGVKEIRYDAGKVKSGGLNISKNVTPNILYSKPDLKAKLIDLARQISMMKGLDNAETSAIGKLLDDIMTKLKDGSVSNQINIAGKAFQNATKSIKNRVAEKNEIEEMETITAEEEVNEALTAETGLIEIGQWANDLLNLSVKDEQGLMTLGGDILTAATGIAGLGGLGLAMYADNIKSGIKKAAAALKNLAKGGGNVQEGEVKDPLAHLDPKIIAALKK